MLGLFLCGCVDCNHGVTIAPPFHGYFILFYFMFFFAVNSPFGSFWTCSIFGWLMLVARCSEWLPSCHLQCSWPSRKVRCEWQRCQKRSAAACSVGSTRVALGTWRDRCQVTLGPDHTTQARTCNGNAWRLRCQGEA